METQPVNDNNDANTVTERHVMLMYMPLVINLTCICCSLKLTVLVYVYSSHNNNKNVGINVFCSVRGYVLLECSPNVMTTYDEKMFYEG